MKSKEPLEVPKSNTVKLDDPMRLRVQRAMRVLGMGTKSDFFRIAATDLCRRTEGELLRTNPEEYRRIYGEG